jgi:hypothetical protein
MATTSSTWSPVDDETYDLLQTLTSKLEAIELYQQYEEDSEGEVQSLFQEMAEQDRRSAERIVGFLRDRFSAMETGQGR